MRTAHWKAMRSDIISKISYSNPVHSRALRRRHSFGGGAPGDFDRRRRRRPIDFFSAAAALGGVGVRSEERGP